MKLDKTKIALVLSVLLNLLGGTGLVPPVIGTPPACPPAAQSH